MAVLSFIIGVIGNVISILVFASPIRTFRGIVRNKSTEEYKATPYITTLLSTSLWTFYGILKPGGLLVWTVNGAGAFLQLIYVVLFIIYAPKDRKVTLLRTVGIVNVGALGLVIAVTLLTLHGGIRLTLVGVLCAALTIGMYAAPLSVMRTVIKMKSVEYMPFSLSFFLFLNAAVWSAYAFLVKDVYIGIPNGLGFFLGISQLVLYSVYMNRSGPRTDVENAEEEEGKAHLVKGDVEIQQPNKNASLRKGRSLPKTTTIARGNSFKKIIKTISLTPVELNHILHNQHEVDEDVENGSRPHS